MMRGAIAAGLVATCGLLSACGSGQGESSGSASIEPSSAATSPRPPASAPSAESAATTSTPTNARQTCADLRDTKVLRSALGFVIVANVVEPGDVTETVTDLQNILDEAPLDYSTPLSEIIQVLQAIDDGARAGDGRDVDTYAVEPDAKQLVKMCRVGKFPVPKLG